MDFNADRKRPGANMRELRVNTSEELSAATRLLMRKGHAELLDMLGLEAQAQPAAWPRNGTGTGEQTNG